LAAACDGEENETAEDAETAEFFFKRPKTKSILLLFYDLCALQVLCDLTLFSLYFPRMKRGKRTGEEAENAEVHVGKGFGRVGPLGKLQKRRGICLARWDPIF
jgi:hypothetical protein